MAAFNSELGRADLGLDLDLDQRALALYHSAGFEEDGPRELVILLRRPV